MTTFNVKVRQDGAINVRAKNRSMLGIRPGSVVQVSFDSKNGSFMCTPLGYTCHVCERSYDTPTDALGICQTCNDMIAQKIKVGEASTMAQAIAMVERIRKATVIKK